MAFTINCNAKGCGQLQSPYLDKDTDKVYCSSCNQEITGLTSIVKNQMKMNKQFRKKEKKPFAVKCVACNMEDRPKLINDKIICACCNKEMTELSPYFITMLKMQLKKSSDI